MNARRTDLALRRTRCSARRKGRRHRRPHAHRADAPRLRRDHGDGGEQAASRALGKPRGTYVTLDLRALSPRTRVHGARGRSRSATSCVLLLEGTVDTALVVGLGNRAMTPDVIGPCAAGSCARHAPPEGLRRLRCARGCQRADARRPRHNGIGGRRARARRGGDRAP